MIGYQAAEFQRIEFSAAMTEDLDHQLIAHFDKGPRQEDLTFAYWRPSRGATRYTGILNHLVLPGPGERILQGNVAFLGDYLTRALDQHPDGCGVALLHSHLGPGWQDMSDDDIVAERDRMGGAVAARTNLPVLGLTWGTDGTWSARFWLREGPNRYIRRWASTVRVVGQRLVMSYHPGLRPVPPEPPAQAATISVWGSKAQADIVRCRTGIVGLGSVGSIVNEALCRVGLQDLTYIDHDRIEERNLDRTAGAVPEDVSNATSKVQVAHRTAERSHTATNFHTREVEESVLTLNGLGAALDCDVLLSCVDRPLPRSLLNTIAKAHLIPLIDGGILARVKEDGLPLHVDWRIHTVGPDRPCLYCIGALRRSDVALDREGQARRPRLHQGAFPCRTRALRPSERVPLQPFSCFPPNPPVRRAGIRHAANRGRRPPALLRLPRDHGSAH